MHWPFSALQMRSARSAASPCTVVIHFRPSSCTRMWTPTGRLACRRRKASKASGPDLRFSHAGARAGPSAALTCAGVSRHSFRSPCGACDACRILRGRARAARRSVARPMLDEAIAHSAPRRDISPSQHQYESYAVLCSPLTAQSLARAPKAEARRFLPYDGFYTLLRRRQSEVRHVAKPLGNGIYAFPESRPRPKARESHLQRRNKAVGQWAAAQPKAQQGLETDSS